MVDQRRNTCHVVLGMKRSSSLAHFDSLCSYDDELKVFLIIIIREKESMQMQCLLSVIIDILNFVTKGV